MQELALFLCGGIIKNMLNDEMMVVLLPLLVYL
jgi:hypothetical protein